jgi:hypothetical protein
MKKYKVKAELSQEGIDEIIKRLELLENKMPELHKRFRKLSLDYLEETAINYIQISTGNSSWYQLTHTLENSFHKDYNLGKLVNDCFYSAFVEYGTGIVGQGTHPDPNRYNYNVNAHVNGWGFEYDGIVHFTRGMEAHRFMYNTVQDYVVGGAYKKIFEKAFDDVMKGVLD